MSGPSWRFFLLFSRDFLYLNPVAIPTMIMLKEALTYSVQSNHDAQDFLSVPGH